ncbi:MAG: dihydrodipicolinate synthase family protein [Candidatus Heimdallarchaeota archaeon]|nr:dihydrodipicolinate synthase family protein [Candidatus Heimdallarchaeota archaeon]
MVKKFKGIGCPCVTPFNDDESLNLISLRELVDFLINSEINAIIPTGNCGESYSLSDEEYRQIIDTVIDQVNDEVPVYIGLPTDNVHRILSIAKYAIDCGADGLVIYPPKTPSLTVNELVNHFDFLSTSIDGNLLIVNDPDSTKIDLPIDLISKLSKQNSIIGIIEISNDFKKIPQISSSVRDDFRVYTGRGLLVPQAIKEGKVEGAIVPSANVVPNLLVELYEAYNVEMKDRFEELQTNLIPLEIGLKLGSFPAAIKASLNMLGLNVGSTRRPISKLQNGDIEKLRNILISVGCLRSAIKENEEERSPPEEVEDKKIKQTKTK